MKILYFSYTMPKPCSMARGPFLFHRIKSLVHKHIDVRVVTTSNIFAGIRHWGRDYNFRHIGWPLDLEGINLPKIEYPYRYIDVLRKRNLHLLMNVFSDHRCDILHAHFVRDGVYAYLLKKKYQIKYITTVHGYDVTLAPFYNPKVRRITRDVLENADKVIFVSASLLGKALELGYSGKNGLVIPNGFDATIFYDQNIKLSDKSKRIVGFCGGLNKRKRADKLPAILHYLSKMDRNIHMLIIGGGSLKSRMIKDFTQYNLRDRVRFTGPIDQAEVANHMNRMDLLILPSHHEGYPTVIPEAQACGLTVVGSDAEGLAEAIGDCGHVVKQGDGFERRFAEAVFQALDSPVDKSKVLQRARRFDWNCIVDREIAVYKDILKE